MLLDRLPRLALLCLATLWLTVACPALAEEDSTPDAWDAPAFSLTAEELLAAAEALPPEEGDEVQIFLQEMRIRFDEEGRREAAFRLIYRVLNATGVEGWSGTSGVFKPWHQERPELRSRVISTEGEERWLDPETVGESPLGDESSDILSDRRIVEAPLPAIGIGSLVEESVVTRDTQPYFAGGAVGSFNFARRGLGIHRVRLVIEAPADLPLQHEARLLEDFKYKRSEVNGRVTLTFEAGPQEAGEPVEELTPGAVPVWPMVRYSTGESWNAVASTYHGRVEEQLAGMDLEEVVEGILGGEDLGRRETIDRLLAWLHQEVRYTGLEFAEAAIIPRPPSETLERGYGDCKDKATLLIALLRTADIPAVVALLNTGPGQDISPKLPGFGFFDHAIVHVPGEGKGDSGLWIDPTDEFARAGELPRMDQGRLALLADPATRELVTTPAADSAENHFVETREIFLNPQTGGGRIVESGVYSGIFERDQRYSLAGVAQEDIDAYFAGYMERVYVAKEFVGIDHPSPEDLTTTFEMRVEAKDARGAFVGLAQATAYVAPDALLSHLPDLITASEEEVEAGEASEITDRQNVLELLTPYSAEQHYRVVPPLGYRPVSVPEDEERTLGPATLTRKVAVEDDGTVTVQYRFDTVKRRFEPEELQALREGVLEIFAADAIRLDFEQTAEAYLAAGKIPEALAELDRLIAAEPERALPRTRRARALMAGGLGDASRREAEAAVELEPDFYLAHQTLGLVHLRDLFGRNYQSGMDQQRAAEAFRRAVELEPDDHQDRENLVALLERNTDGIHYGPGAPLEEAIQEHEAICDDETLSLCYETNLLLLYGVTGRFEKMEEWVSKAGRKADAFTLIAQAVSQGSDTALRTARTIQGKNQPHTALGEAGQLLMKWRQYGLAADLLAASAQGSPDPSRLFTVADLMRKVQRFEDMEFDTDDPEGFSKLLAIMALDAEPEAFLEILTEGAKKTLGERMQEELEEVQEGMQDVWRQGMSPRMAMELGFGAMQFAIDGDDTRGYRVRMVGDLVGQSTDEVTFLVRKDGELRVAADQELHSIGYQVLRWVDESNLAAARQWLDWALELVPKGSSGDPYAGDPFFHFWTAGQEADATALREAAACLLTASETFAEDALPILLAGHESATEGDGLGYELALARAYEKLERGEPLFLLAQRWIADRPDSFGAYSKLTEALALIKDWAGLEQAARERLELLPDDASARRSLVRVAVERGDTGERRRLYEELLGLSKANAEDYWRLAWMDITAGQTTDLTVERAQQAVGREKESWQTLYVLATAYAELGRSTEARQILYQAMDAHLGSEARSEDWYAWGRIAESYGVPDSAILAYDRVTRPEEEEDEIGQTAWRLAQARLEALGSGDSKAADAAR